MLKKHRAIAVGLATAIALNGCAFLNTDKIDTSISQRCAPDTYGWTRRECRQQEPSNNTLLAGRQVITVTTIPDGATCVSEQQTVTTPGHFQLARNTSHTIECRKDSYQTATVFVGSRLNGAVWFNLVTFFVVGIAVDYWTGAANILTPAVVSIKLTPTHG